MIDLYNIVDTLSELVDKDKGILVLHKGMTQNPKFKVYKDYHYTLFLVKGKEKTSILSYTEGRYSISSEIDKDWKECDNNFLKVLLSWVGSDDFIKLKNGI